MTVDHWGTDGRALPMLGDKGSADDDTHVLCCSSHGFGVAVTTTRLAAGRVAADSKGLERRRLHAVSLKLSSDPCGGPGAADRMFRIFTFQVFGDDHLTPVVEAPLDQVARVDEGPRGRLAIGEI